MHVPTRVMGSSILRDATLSTLECVRVLRWLGFDVAATDETTIAMRREEDTRTVLVPRGQMQLTSEHLDVICLAAGMSVMQLLALAQPRFKSDIMPRVSVPASRRIRRS
jgi:hypothetical protein